MNLRLDGKKALVIASTAGIAIESIRARAPGYALSLAQIDRFRQIDCLVRVC